MALQPLRASFLACVSAAGALGGFSPAGLAQNFETIVQAEVWDGTRWASQATVRPGARVEYRVTTTYVGSRTDVVALGNLSYVVAFGGFDNTGTLRDGHAPLCGGVVTCPDACVTGQFSTAGTSPAVRANYGPVNFSCSALTSAAPSFKRYGGDEPQNGAPPGSWATISRGLVTWPGSGTASELSINALRGLAASQTSRVSPITGLTNSGWLAGTMSLPFFRGALTLSPETGERTLSVSTLSQRGGELTAAWQIGSFDSGALSTTALPAPAFVIVSQCNDVDFNNDGVSPDLQDIADYFGVFVGQGCAGCDSIDFNNDGVFPDVADAIEFFGVLAGGACGA
jgi:hypothetical protein